MTTNQNTPLGFRSNLNGSIPSTLHNPTSAPHTSYPALNVPTPRFGLYQNATTTNTNNQIAAANSSYGSIQQSISASKNATTSSTPLNSPSPRHIDGGLQTHSPVATFSSPNSSPVTPMGTDTDFSAYPSPRMPGLPVAAGQDTASKQQQHSSPQVQQQPTTPTSTQFSQTAHATSQRSSLEPHQSPQHQQSPQPHQSPQSRQSINTSFVLSDEAIKILQKNTKRLLELEQNMRQLVSFGSASDEFLLWLRDPRAYNVENENPLMKCAEAVYQSSPKFGPWTGLQIIKTINKNSQHLSVQSQEKIREWYNDILRKQNLITSPQIPALAPPNALSNTSLVIGSASPPLATPPAMTSPGQPTSPLYPPNLQHLQQQQRQRQQRLKDLQIHRHQLQREEQQQQQQQMQQQQQQQIHQQQPQPVFLQNTGHIPMQQNPPHRQSGQEMMNFYAAQGQYMTLQQQQHFQQFLPYLQNTIGRPPFHLPTLPPMGSFLPQQTSRGPNPTSSIAIPTSISLPMTPGQRPPPPPSSLVPEHLRPLHNHRTHYAINPFMVKHERLQTDAVFYINSDDYRRIKLSKDTVANKDLLPINLVLSSWKAKTDESKCEWPEHASLLINNREPPLQKRRKVETTSDRPIYMGKDAPFNIADWVVEGKNVLTVNQHACSCNYNFAIGVYLCQSQDMITNALKDTVIDISSGQQSIDRLLENGDAQDDDIEIVQKSIVLNLKCPISLTVIKTPTKGAHCKHPACFDLSSYLAMNKGLIPRWKCPICNNPTPPTALRRDMFFQNLLLSVPRGAYEVMISGSHKNYKVTKTDTNDDSDTNLEDDDTKEPLDKLNAIQPRTSTDINMATSSGGDNVISLLSDDEDDDGNEHNGTTNGNTSDNAGETNDDGHRQKRHRAETPTVPVDTTPHSNTTAPATSDAPVTATIHTSNPATTIQSSPDATVTPTDAAPAADDNDTDTTDGFLAISDTPGHWKETLQNLLQPNVTDGSNS